MPDGFPNSLPITTVADASQGRCHFKGIGPAIVRVPPAQGVHAQAVQQGDGLLPRHRAMVPSRSITSVRPCHSTITAP